MIAKQRLLSQNLSLVAEKNGEVFFSSSEIGLKPAFALLNMQEAVGASVADKIVGKAAATIFINLGVEKVFAKIISQAAIDFLTKNNVSFEYEIKIPKILNRLGNDYCPMEKSVIDIDCPQKALTALFEKRNALMRQASSN